MRVVLQRVSEASVTIDGVVTGKIGAGLLLLIGFEESDSQEDLTWMAQKILQMRIFKDENGLMNLSVLDTNGDLLVISQFTLFAQTKKGNRPSFMQAAKSDKAIPLYHSFLEIIQKDFPKPIQTGTFGADMQVQLINDGPITIMLNSKNKE